jgi:hypothetical protein
MGQRLRHLAVGVSVSYARRGAGGPDWSVQRMSREVPITAESLVAWSEIPVAAEVDHEVVLMNVGRGRCYGLGETGSSVWRRLSSPIRVDDLCRELLLEYRADRDVLKRDVLALLEQMQEEGLVKVIGK